ncbi:MAG: HD domain-containing protein [Candidatus Thermoplasmatota archaeon]|nr:HD domain-containing protein [Candidatus Thermoplasmatota archaeon]
MTDLFHYEKQADEQTMIKPDGKKRKKIQFIEKLHEGETVNDLFSVKRKNAPRGYKKGTFFDLILTDKTGEINVKFWGGNNKERVKRLFESFSTGDVVQLRSGSVERYQDRLQISINEKTGGIRRCNAQEYDESDFVAALSEGEIKRLFESMQTYIETISNPSLNALLESFFEDEQFVEAYTHTPSAMSHHHNVIGGNLQHSLGVVKLSYSIAEYYTDLDRDLLITGAILHDIGKIKSYKTTTTIGRTDVGNFIGHIVVGSQWIQDKISGLRKKDISFDEVLELKLCHMILSHHGRLEYGSPKLPAFPEAAALFQADLMDSQVKNFLQKIEQKKEDIDEHWSFMYDSNINGKKPVYIDFEKQKNVSVDDTL